MNKIIVNGQTMHFYSHPEPVPQGQVQFSVLEFVFDNAWDGMAKLAQFIQGDTVVTNVLIEENKCFVPPNLSIGEFQIALRGDGASGKIGTVNRLQLEVVPSYKTGGSPPVPPDPDLYNDLIQRVENAASHGPKIQNGNWWVWNFEAEQYVDTGVVASGGSGGGSYTLPTASAAIKGGVKIGKGLTMTGEVLSADGETVDTAMSDTSPRAVQNKVIKAYVDTQLGGISELVGGGIA